MLVNGNWFEKNITSSTCVREHLRPWYNGKASLRVFEPFIAACRAVHAIPALHTQCRIRKAEILLETPSNPLWSCLQVRSFESSDREIGFRATGYVWMALKGSEWGDRRHLSNIRNSSNGTRKPILQREGEREKREDSSRRFTAKVVLQFLRVEIYSSAFEVIKYIYTSNFSERIVLPNLVQRERN